MQMLRSMSGKDKFVDRRWRKAEFYYKQRSSSFSRYQNCLCSASDLEAETAFKMQNGMTNSSRSQALTRVYSRNSRGHIKGPSPVKRLPKGRRSGKSSCEISSSLRSSYNFYNGSENCSLNSSCISSRGEGISRSCNFSYDECCDKNKYLIMDPLHASKSTSNHAKQCAFALHGRKEWRNHTFHSFKNHEYHEQLGDLDQSVREIKENHVGLSQKYRPKSFNEFVGQEIIRKSLMNAILKQKIAPVYLFYGPRGTGKKSAARIFASALNCSSPDARIKPCCKCRECCLCLSGESPHMAELNAAGNDGIEILKLCLETVKYDHMASGYKVVIVEDCHELSPEAWSTSFLKCMENAIGYLVFILIAVDLDWIPKTVMSRSQKFCFQKLRDTDILNRLKKIVVAENINIEEEALHLITTRAGGSLWEAETALEQFSLLSSKITLSRVRQMIGLLPDEKLLDLLDFALSADIENTVRCTQEIIECGVKPLALVSQLATLVTSILASNCLSSKADETQISIGNSSISMDKTEKLGRALKILSDAEKQLRASNECVSWLTAVLLQFGSDELNPNPHPAIDTNTTHTNMALYNQNQREVYEMDHALEEEIAHHIDHWNVYQAPHKVPSATKSRAFEDKDSRNVDSLDTKWCLAESSINPFCNQGTIKTVHSHDTQGIIFPVPSSSQNCTSEAENLDLRPMSPCTVEEIWKRVLKTSQSTTLEDLLQGQGKLVSLLLCQANAGAIAHVELRNHQRKAKVERLELSISNALQEALGCPVEVKMMVPSCCENNIPLDGSNSIPYNPKATLHCHESKLNSSKHRILRKRRKFGLPFNCVPCLNLSCICFSLKRCLCADC
ncbi:hypothetical protein SUGI_1107970 [Cryptomeria japonica]|nr:hypothetical protein SUGI_1107970 [Cryptomeria japonica]